MEQRTCSEFLCMRLTKHGKPYCSKHVCQNAYAQVVLGMIRTMLDAKEQLADYGQHAKDACRVLAKELLVRLRHDHGGAASMKRMASAMGIKVRVLASLVLVMKRANLLTVTRGERGGIVLSLPVKITL